MFRKKTKNINVKLILKMKVNIATSFEKSRKFISEMENKMINSPGDWLSNKNRRYATGQKSNVSEMGNYFEARVKLPNQF